MRTVSISPKELSDTQDVQLLFRSLKERISPEDRISIGIFNVLWKSFSGSWRGNWLNVEDVLNLLELEGYQIIKVQKRFFGTEHHIVAKLRPAKSTEASVSIVIPVRNEKGNLEALIRRIPKFGTRRELIFVEGHSNDGSWAELVRLKKLHPSIRIYKQKGIGKADAMREGFARATGDILLILDADLSVAPEDLPKFYGAITSGSGEFINGSRLVYPVEREAMRYLNILGNQFFSRTLSWIISQHIKDTLCGTKAISRKYYALITKNRKHFGEFDPFGDFDLIFGSAYLNLKIVEIPVRYHARTYGSTNISRFVHGMLLLRMTLFALIKFKFS